MPEETVGTEGSQNSIRVAYGNSTTRKLPSRRPFLPFGGSAFADGGDGDEMNTIITMRWVGTRDQWRPTQQKVGRATSRGGGRRTRMWRGQPYPGHPVLALGSQGGGGCGAGNHTLDVSSSPWAAEALSWATVVAEFSGAGLRGHVQAGVEGGLQNQLSRAYGQGHGRRKLGCAVLTVGG